MSKKSILNIVLSSLNLCILLPLLILVVPQEVPILFSATEKILLTASKWVLTLNILLPILLFFAYTFERNENFKFVITASNIFVSYVNMLTFSYFCTQTNFQVNELPVVPFSLSIFLPISLWLFVYGSKVKRAQYKSGFGICTKNTTTTSFIWGQSHIFASYFYRLAGFIGFVISIIFTFVRQPIIELLLFAIIILSAHFGTDKQAKDMAKKYYQMKANQEKQEKHKDKS